MSSTTKSYIVDLLSWVFFSPVLESRQPETKEFPSKSARRNAQKRSGVDTKELLLHVLQLDSIDLSKKKKNLN